MTKSVLTNNALKNTFGVSEVLVRSPLETKKFQIAKHLNFSESISRVRAGWKKRHINRNTLVSASVTKQLFKDTIEYHPQNDLSLR